MAQLQVQKAEDSQRLQALNLSDSDADYMFMTVSADDIVNMAGQLEICLYATPGCLSLSSIDVKFAQYGVRQWAAFRF